MTVELSINNQTMDQTYQTYEKKFKALADKKRLQLMKIICQYGSVCVSDLSELVEMPQSKLSYHLKILLDTDLIKKETKGTWSYYRLNESELNQLLSEESYSLFQNAAK